MKLCFYATVFACIGSREVVHGVELSIIGLTLLTRPTEHKITAGHRPIS